MQRKVNVRRYVAVAATTVAGATVCSGYASSAAASQAKAPITIGISQSLSGDFSSEGKAAIEGYRLWQKEVNSSGGLMGRQVRLKIVDDASNPSQVVTNYTTLITRDHVNLVLGPFSTLLTVAAAPVVSRYGYAFIFPAGGGTQLDKMHLHNVFYVQPGTSTQQVEVFAHFVLSLPASKRPKTAAYPSIDDPYALPQVRYLQSLFQRAGIRTVYQTTIPSESINMSPAVTKIAGSHADMVVAGTIGDSDSTSIVKAMIQQHYSPKFLFMTNGANNPAAFPGEIGAGNTQGIFSYSDWMPESRIPGNARFVSAFVKAYGGKPSEIDPTAAEAYACGELLQEAVARAHSTANAKLIATLHRGSWNTIDGGALRFDSLGRSREVGAVLTEWVNKTLLPVYPHGAAVTHPRFPKPQWR